MKGINVSLELIVALMIGIVSIFVAVTILDSGTGSLQTFSLSQLPSLGGLIGG